MAQGLLLTVLLAPGPRGQVALAMSAMIVVAQLAPAGADHAIAVSGGRPSVRDMAPWVRAVVIVLAAGLLIAVTRGRSWPASSDQLTVLWSAVALSAPLGVMVIADLQRNGRHSQRIVAQAAPLVLGSGGLAVLALAGRFSVTAALVVLAGAAIVALPVRVAINASSAEPDRASPAPGFNRTALSYLAVHVPAMSIQRADQIILAMVSTMTQAGYYAVAASIAFLQTAVTEQVLKREVASGHRSNRQALGWAAASYLTCLALLIAVSLVLPDYADVLVPGVVLCTGWFLHFAAYRQQLLTVGANQSPTPALVAVAHVGASIVLAGRYGATGAAAAFLLVNAVWLAAALRGRS